MEKVPRRRAPVLTLVESCPNLDTVRELEMLLRQAKEGEVIGIAYVAMYRGYQYEADIVGESRKVPALCHGMLRWLARKLDQLQDRRFY